MPNPPRPDAEALFHQAIVLPAGERMAFLERVAGPWPELQAEVKALLAADEQAGDFLHQGIDSTRLAEAMETIGLRPGQRVGPWILGPKLGEGGMGTVHLAERADGEFRQQVAVKLVRPGLNTADVLTRFQHERQLLATLRHPHIAHLIDGGATPDGHPYLVMEYVEGVPIDQYTAQADLPVRQRLELMLQVCDAVSYAHRHLVVHRDLKPGNLLVDVDGNIKLLDFGIARVLDPEAMDTGMTQPGQRLLSPRYASPEQVAGHPPTTATDVYSLGVILYELLSDHSPYPAPDSSLRDLERAVVDLEPGPPSDQAPPDRQLDRDLDAVVMKALRKEPGRRYADVVELADDLRRYLDGRPVLARPDTRRYRLGKFIRRHRSAVAVAAAAAVLLLGASAVSTIQYLRAQQQQRTATAVSGFLEQMLASIDPEIARGQDTALLTDLLHRAAADLEQGRVPDSRAAADLHATVGNAFASVAEFEPAQRHLQRSLALTGDDVSRAHRLADLGRIQHDLGDYPAAEASLRAALELGAGAAAHHQLGLVLTTVGLYDEAEAQIRLAVAAAPDDPVLIQALGTFLMYNRRDFDQADRLLNRALTMAGQSEEVGALVEPEIRLALATNERYRGNLDAAVAQGRAGLEGYEKLLPAHHPSLATARDRLAGVLEEAGLLDEAETLYVAALADLSATLGPDHRDVGTAHNNLASLLRKTDRASEAAPHYAEAVRIYRATLGDEHPWLAIITGGQAANSAALGHWDEAETQGRWCLEARRRHWPEDHWRLATVENLLGACLLVRGELDAAEVRLVASRAVLAAQLGEDHSSVALADERLAALARVQAGGSLVNLR